jgi:hypothetical protein
MGKPVRAVLRGLGGSNSVWLPGVKISNGLGLPDNSLPVDTGRLNGDPYFFLTTNSFLFYYFF